MTLRKNNILEFERESIHLHSVENLFALEEDKDLIHPLRAVADHFTV